MVDSDQSVVSALMSLLSSRPSSTDVFNPYFQVSGPDSLLVGDGDADMPLPLINLGHFFEDLLAQPRIDLLLIGEAPGFLGCAQTGIPFSSPALCALAPTRQWRRLLPLLNLEGAEPCRERTASAVWEVIAGRSMNVCCWNAFPYHPCLDGNRRSNRKPRVEELREGQLALNHVLMLCTNAVWVAVGRSAEAAMNRLDLPPERWSAVRHPSYGGLTQFRQQMTALLDQWPVQTGQD